MAVALVYSCWLEPYLEFMMRKLILVPSGVSSSCCFEVDVYTVMLLTAIYNCIGWN